MPMKTLFSLVVLSIIAFTIVAGGLSSSSGGKAHSYDFSKMSDLTKLYNSGVHQAERLTRPLSSLHSAQGPLSHSGVRITLEDGSKWLIHKGNDFGVTSQTVVVDAKHMSNQWMVDKTKDFHGAKTVSDLVKAGGSDYNLLRDNCHHGAERMMEQDE